MDILVNSAGVMLLSKIERGLSDQWHRMFDVDTSIPGRAKLAELRFRVLLADGAREVRFERVPKG